MPWSAQHIAPQSSLAMKTARVPAGGNFSWGGTPPVLSAPTIPAATAPAVNPQADQRTDAVAPPRSPPTDPKLKDSTLGSRYFGRIDPSPATVSKDAKLDSATSKEPGTAAKALQARVGATSLADSKLGSRGASTAPAVKPGSLIQASTFKSPYAPQFLTDAVTGLNETQSYTAMMHDEWRNTLLRASESNPNLLPALAAASIQSGAKFSLGLGGGGSTGAPTQRQPSYWEQKLAMEDQDKASKDLKMGQDMLEQSRMSPGIGGSWNYQNTLAKDAQDRIDKANAALAMSRRVLGTQSESEMIKDRDKQLRSQYYGSFSPSQVNAAKGNNPWTQSYDAWSGFGSGWTSMFG